MVDCPLIPLILGLWIRWTDSETFSFLINQPVAVLEPGDEFISFSKHTGQYVNQFRLPTNSHYTDLLGLDRVDQVSEAIKITRHDAASIPGNSVCTSSSKGNWR